MAVTQRGSATTDIAVAGTATVTKPTGVTTGDLLIAKCTSYDTAGQTVISAGWTLLAETVPGGTSSTSLHILARTVTDGGTEPASYDFDETTAYYLTVEVTAWSGVDAVTVGTFTSGGSGSGAGAKTLPGITMPAAGQLLAACSAYNVATVVGTTHKTESIPGASTIAIPGGAVAGDLAILIVSGNDGDASLDAAFTQVGSKAVTDTTTESIVGKRTLTGADIIAGTLPIVGPPSFNIADYTLWVLHSASGTPVVDAAVSYTSSDAGITDPTILTFPAATASGTNNTVIVATGGRNTFTGWSSPPGDVTPDYTTAGIWNGHFDQPASGSTGTRTVSTADAYARWTSWTIVVKHPSGWTSLSSPWSVLVENLDSVNSLFAKAVASGATGDVSVSTTGTTSFAAVLIGLVEPVGVTSVPTVWGLPASAV